MVRVRLFAGLREMVGTAELEFPWEQHLTIAQLRIQLYRHHQKLEKLLRQSRAAINDHLAEDADLIPDQSEISFLPPVSGG